MRSRAGNACHSARPYTPHQLSVRPKGILNLSRLALFLFLSLALFARGFKKISLGGAAHKSSAARRCCFFRCHRRRARFHGNEKLKVLRWLPAQTRLR